MGVFIIEHVNLLGFAVTDRAHVDSIALIIIVDAEINLIVIYTCSYPNQFRGLVELVI